MDTKKQGEEMARTMPGSFFATKCATNVEAVSCCANTEDSRRLYIRLCREGANFIGVEQRKFLCMCSHPSHAMATAMRVEHLRVRMELRYLSVEKVEDCQAYSHNERRNQTSIDVYPETRKRCRN